MTQFDTMPSPSSSAADPVCGMAVPMTAPLGASHQHQGTEYRFCSDGCRQAFAEAPEHFLAAPGRHGPGGKHLDPA